MMKNKFLFTTSVLSLLSLQGISAASAQEAIATKDQAAAETGVALQDTIIVTATRREGTIQDLPINVAAVSGADIEEQGIEELSDLLATIPGINIVDRGPRQGNPIVVRGLNANPIGSGDGNNDGGGTVATYLGDIPVFVDLKLNDMERVEVLLGPQGTLYGAGTLAGAIRYIPIKPQFLEDTLSLRSDLYHYSEAGSISSDFGLTFNKSFGDKFAIRGSVDVLNDSGFIDQPFLVREIGVSNPDPDFSDINDVSANLFGKEDVDFEDTISGRIAARFVPTDWLDGTLTYYYQDVETGGRRISHARSNVIDAGDYDNAFRVEEPNKITNELLALEVGVDLGFAELTSATGLSKFEDDGARDQNNLLITLEYSYEIFPSFASLTEEKGEEETFTQEVRLVSSTESIFNWIIGGFYSQSEAHAYSYETTPGFVPFVNDLGFGYTDRPDALEYFSIGHEELTESAIFGEFGVDFTDKLSVTVGARSYEYDLKAGADVTSFYGADRAFENVFFPHFEAADFQPLNVDQIRDLPYDPSQSDSDEGILYKFNISYDFTDDLLGYFTISQGYRTGASNGQATCPEFDPDDNQQGACALAPGQRFGPGPNDLSVIDERRYGPDKTTNYEIGAKTTWLDGDLIVNGAVFLVEWEEPQVDGATVNANIPITVNASAAESVGLELQSAWQITEQFDVTGAFSYTRSELTEAAPALIRFTGPPSDSGTFPSVFDDGEVGDRLPGSPEQQFSFFGNYTIPMDNGAEWKINGGYAWQDEVFRTTGGRGIHIATPSYGIAKASATYLKDDWSVSLYANNLFNEYIETAVFGSQFTDTTVPDINGDPVSVRSLRATVAPPLTVGIRMKYDF